MKENGSVVWRLGLDAHDELLKIAGLKDVTATPSEIKFARVEISPANGNYLAPDKWELKVDEKIKPSWWGPGYERAAWDAKDEWQKETDAILVRKPIVHPFKVKPPKKITEKHIDLLKSWASVRASVKANVWDSIGANVWDSVWDSVKASVWDSIVASVWSYVGSFFNLPRKVWKHTENIKCTGYPFQPAVDLWEMGLVPSFDGTTWRLHGGKKAKVLWEGNLT